MKKNIINMFYLVALMWTIILLREFQDIPIFGKTRSLILFHFSTTHLSVYTQRGWSGVISDDFFFLIVQRYSNLLVKHFRYLFKLWLNGIHLIPFSLINFSRNVSILLNAQLFALSRWKSALSTPQDNVMEFLF